VIKFRNRIIIWCILFSGVSALVSVVFKRLSRATLVIVVLGVLVLLMVAMMSATARCPACGFYRDPELPGCNCRES
jgi:hypothetical protein